MGWDGVTWRRRGRTQKQGESLTASVGRLKGHPKDVLIEEAVRTRCGEIVWSPDGVLLKPEEAALPDFKANADAARHAYARRGRTHSTCVVQPGAGRCGFQARA